MFPPAGLNYQPSGLIPVLERTQSLHAPSHSHSRDSAEALGFYWIEASRPPLTQDEKPRR